MAKRDAPAPDDVTLVGRDYPYATYQEIMDIPDLHEEDVPVPRWGRTVRVRELVADEILQIQQDSRDPQTGEIRRPDLIKRMTAASLVNPRLSYAQVQALFASKSADAMGDIILAVERINGAGEKAQVDAEDSFPERSAEGLPVHAGAEAG